MPSKFLPRLSDVCEPLQKLTLPDVEWFWTNLHDSAVQQNLTKGRHPAERRIRQGALSSPNARQPPHCICEPCTDGSRNPLCPDRERAPCCRLWTGKVPHLHTYRRRVTVESDHKPLEVIVKKPIHLAPKRLQHMLLRVQVYSINLGYRKGSSEPGISSLRRKSNNCIRS